MTKEPDVLEEYSKKLEEIKNRKYEPPISTFIDQAHKIPPSVKSLPKNKPTSAPWEFTDKEIAQAKQTRFGYWGKYSNEKVGKVWKENRSYIDWLEKNTNPKFWGKNVEWAIHVLKTIEKHNNQK